MVEQFWLQNHERGINNGVCVFAVAEVPERSATYNLQGNIDAGEESA